MTNKEAITKLTNIMYDDHYSWSPEVLTTFGMAVDALKASDLVNESGGLVKDSQGDCISRQAALDCFHDWVDRRGDVHTPDEMAEYLAIEALPAVQIEPEDCDTCKHGYFGDSACDNCRVRYPSHYESEERRES